MYWQQRFGRENPDEELENKISEIFIKSNKTYGYRRITVRRIMNKLELKCVAFSHLQGYYITFKPVENFCIIVI